MDVILINGEHMQFKKIYIEITNVCNLHCSFCIQHQRPSAYMDLSSFSHILQQIQPYTRYIYLHVMGEPLLHPQLHDFLILAKQMGFFVNLTSNATLLKQRKNILLGNIRQLNLSIHSLPMEQGCHPVDYMEQCLDVGDALAEHDTYVSYRFWNQKQGRLDHESMRALDMIFDHYQIAKTYENTCLKDKRFLHFEEQFAWPDLFSPWISATGSCYGLRHQCAILVDGSVVPCCLDAKGVLTLGNIMEQPFSKILSSSKVQAIIQGFQNRKCVASLCQHCGYRMRFDEVKK